MNYEEMKIKLQSRLKPSRYEHSVGVAETAVFLAERFHVDVDKARIAGLLHDCARQYSNEQLPQEASGRGIAIGPVEKEMPLLLHGYVGAQLIAEEYDVDSPEIAQAIYRHTVGGPHMTDLDKIVYFADINWKLLMKLIAKSSVTYKEISKFPAVSRDLALLLDKGVEFAEIEKIAYSTEKKLLREVRLFDVYEGKNLPAGKKSYAVNFILQDTEKTLNDKQIDAIMQKLIGNLTKQLDAELR